MNFAPIPLFSMPIPLQEWLKCTNIIRHSSTLCHSLSLIVIHHALSEVMHREVVRRNIWIGIVNS
jgi:hypothetical protein